MRLFDRISAGEDVYGDGDQPVSTDEIARLRKLANTSVRVVADDAADFYWQSDKSQWSAVRGDFGPLIPPFENMWIEWNLPEDRLIKNDFDRVQFAVHIHAVNGKNGFSFLMDAFLIHYPGTGICKWDYLIYLKVGADGLEVGAENNFPWTRCPFYKAKNHMAPEEFDEWFACQFHPALLAIGWMNCRNTTLTDVEVPELVALRRRKRGQPEGLSYRRISVGKPSNARANYVPSESKVRQRNHMVRGHFKTYTDQNKLFGRLTGTYWWQWQVRGDKSLGTINHEYHVSSRAAQ